MGHLGVSQSYSDKKNLAIIIKKYVNDPETTMKQTTFLCLCWKGKHRERAKSYLEALKAFRQMTKEQQKAVLEECERALEDSYITKKVIM